MRGTDGTDRKAGSIYARLAGREKCVRSTAEGIRLLIHRLGGREQGALTALWKQWDRIMGEELAALGRPLGHKDQILSVGAGDSMALQELSLRSPEILELANAALGREFFTEVRVLLLQGETGLVSTQGETGPVFAQREAGRRMQEAREQRGPVFAQGETNVVPGAAGTGKSPPPAPPGNDAPPLGALLGRLNPASPITRCYERFVALSGKRAGRG